MTPEWVVPLIVLLSVAQGVVFVIWTIVTIRLWQAASISLRAGIELQATAMEFWKVIHGIKRSFGIPPEEAEDREEPERWQSRSSA